MQWMIPISGGKSLMFEDHGDKNQFLKVSVVDDTGSCITLGVVEKNDVKRLGKGM